MTNERILTQHMNQLIHDLLAFSRLSRADMQLMPIDMEALARRRSTN